MKRRETKSRIIFSVCFASFKEHHQNSSQTFSSNSKVLITFHCYISLVSRPVPPKGVKRWDGKKQDKNEFVSRLLSNQTRNIKETTMRKRRPRIYFANQSIYLCGYIAFTFPVLLTVLWCHIVDIKSSDGLERERMVFCRYSWGEWRWHDGVKAS